VVVVDRDAAGARAVAGRLGDGASARVADVTVAAEVEALVAAVEDEVGPIDLVASNAGVVGLGGVEVPDETWSRVWAVNVMAHVYAARAVLPSMLARGEGYLLTTASAAGLLTNLGAAPYSVTKHAALAFAEWLSTTYRHRGIQVHAVCPQGVRTNMLEDTGTAGDLVLVPTAIEPEEVADTVLKGIAENRFLILPHPEVSGFYAARATDTDRWLRSMNRVQRTLDETEEKPPR
jgi:NAD(P)-dependent dehydrogenase (short-subunit alcohol dehydrogenase family)